MKNKTRMNSLLTLTLFLATITFSQNLLAMPKTVHLTPVIKRYKVQDVRPEDHITEITVTEDQSDFEKESLPFRPLYENHHGHTRGGGGGTNPIAIIKAIMTLGERAWDLVIQGKPAIHSTHKPISVLPQVEGKDIVPMDLENWSLPKSKTYTFSAKNKFGKEIINFKYSVHFTYGGSYKGQGKFLAAVDISPLNVKLAWGQKFNSHTQLLEVVNHGTKQNPLVSALMSVTYSIKSMTRSTQATANYHIVADGRIIPLQ